MAEEIACVEDSSNTRYPNRSNLYLSTDYIPSYDTLSIEYKMDFPEKSLCYIFNHTKYDPAFGLEARKSSTVDCANIYNCFSRLNFDIYTFTNKKACEIMTELESVSKKKHKERAAFVCFILTHGNWKKLCAYDEEYSVEEVFKYFAYDQCTSLNGKPKLFFIQASDGNKIGSGIPARVKESADGPDDIFNIPGDIFNIPSVSDIFIAFSSVKDYVSSGSPMTGSLFIEVLCECLDNYAKNIDLLHIMTFVNQGVALFESSFEKSIRDRDKQISVWFTLTKLLKFTVLS